MRRNFDQNVIYKFTNSDDAPKQKFRQSKYKKNNNFDLAKLAEQLVAESQLLFAEEYEPYEEDSFSNYSEPLMSISYWEQDQQQDPLTNIDLVYPSYAKQLSDSTADTQAASSDVRMSTNAREFLPSKSFEDIQTAIEWRYRLDSPQYLSREVYLTNSLKYNKPWAVKN